MARTRCHGPTTDRAGLLGEGRLPGLVAPAEDGRVGAHAAGREIARRDRQEGLLGHGRLTVGVVAPAHCATVRGQAAAVVVAGADADQAVGRGVQLVAVVAAPAHGGAVDTHRTGVGEPGAHGDVLPGRCLRLPVAVAAPAGDAAIDREGAGVRVTRAHEPEAALGRGRLALVVVAPAGERAVRTGRRRYVGSPRRRRGSGPGRARLVVAVVAPAAHGAVGDDTAAVQVAAGAHHAEGLLGWQRLVAGAAPAPRCAVAAQGARVRLAQAERRQRLGPGVRRGGAHGGASTDPERGQHEQDGDDEGAPEAAEHGPPPGNGSLERPGQPYGPGPRRMMTCGPVRSTSADSPIRRPPGQYQPVGGGDPIPCRVQGLRVAMPELWLDDPVAAEAGVPTDEVQLDEPVAGLERQLDGQVDVARLPGGEPGKADRAHQATACPRPVQDGHRAHQPRLEAPALERVVPGGPQTHADRDEGARCRGHGGLQRRVAHRDAALTQPRDHAVVVGGRDRGAHR